MWWLHPGQMWRLLYYCLWVFQIWWLISRTSPTKGSMAIQNLWGKELENKAKSQEPWVEAKNDQRHFLKANRRKPALPRAKKTRESWDEIPNRAVDSAHDSRFCRRYITKKLSHAWFNPSTFHKSGEYYPQTSSTTNGYWFLLEVLSSKANPSVLWLDFFASTANRHWVPPSPSLL